MQIPSPNPSINSAPKSVDEIKLKSFFINSIVLILMITGFLTSVSKVQKCSSQFCHAVFIICYKLEHNCWLFLIWLNGLLKISLRLTSTKFRTNDFFSQI
jgi:uncharacterized MAPEG superfamily protein